MAGKLIILCREVTGSRICNTAAAVMSLFIAGMLQKFQQCICAVQVDLQGVPFIFAGDEMMRDKKGVHNSYNSPDSINTIDWKNKTAHKDVFEYVKGLIAMRKAVHASLRRNKAVKSFRLGNYGEGESGVTVVELK